MQDNKELFDFLKITENSQEAENLNSLTGALSTQIRQNKTEPSKEVINRLMQAAQEKTQKKNAIKSWFGAFSYKKLAVAAAAVLIMIAAPLTVLKNTTGFNLDTTEIYSSSDDALFDLLDEDIQDLLYGLNEI
ncbi:hypothetical protein Dip510_000720 [Elusimicrobium posterum]|uniref:hypothetical protein n=1 Tax=Elusimicrobium posterum TaxID=3116653 RepID=UPI003C7551B4